MTQETRKIVHIDEDKCDGCGACVPGCAEGAIQVIDGKARLVSEVYCDGLGACLGHCPRGAITIEERPAEPFNEQAVREYLATKEAETPRAPQPASSSCPSAAVRVLDTANPPHPMTEGGCPGTALRQFQAAAMAADTSRQAEPSALGHWPVQLRLVPPGAPFLKRADLLVCADCVPFAVPDFHRRYLAGRAVLVGCPKLDDIQAYRHKLAQIFAEAQPRSVTVLRMEVPCCAALAHAVIEARDASAPHLSVQVDTIGIRGHIDSEFQPGPAAR